VGEEHPNPQDVAEQAPANPPASDDAQWSQWGNLWQVPSLLLSMTLIAAGIFVASSRSQPHDFDGALSEIEQLITLGELDAASNRIQDVIEPHLLDASQFDQGRYHSAVADLLAARQETEGFDESSYDARIDEQYAEAISLGRELNPVQLERWANALVDLGRLDEARQRMEELEALELASDGAVLVRDRRNRILRRIVASTVRRADQSFDTAIELITRYRGDARLTAADHAWAAARLAELYIHEGFPQQAIDQLLVDIRRIENRAETLDETISYAELDALLGRAYFDVGNNEYAEYHIDRAMQGLLAADPIRADGYLVLALISKARGELDTAFSHFDLIVRDFPTTRAFIPGLLGRAEIRSVLGEHGGSMLDYERLAGLIGSDDRRRDVSPIRVARSLCDRHDAALAMGRLDLALQYMNLAKPMYAQQPLPAEVLIRLASTHRQMAESLLAQEREALESDGSPPDQPIDPATRHQANIHYKAAAEFFVQHARAMMERPDSDQAWGDSLWLAGDSYDLGGYPNLAIEHFQEYLGGRGPDDARRPMVTFRLAMAYLAEQQYEQAVEYFRKTGDEHPRSAEASRVHVPLSRALVKLGRPQEAIQTLQRVVAGNGVLEPAAPDYRDALIELGALYKDQNQYAQAIVHLTNAVHRYPDDPNRASTMYLLADSYRRSALEAENQIRTNTTLSPRELQALDQRRILHLSEAERTFNAVCDLLDAVPVHRMTQRQWQYARDAHLYRGDCAYALGRYMPAVEYYDSAARAFSSDYSSLVALIQIVNCYNAVSDDRRAHAAHQRARDRLGQLPDDAFRNQLMDRAAWERWLRENPPAANTNALTDATQETSA
jgi:tetratricopeptide (TPR) repeat protein